ncbi:MAG: Gfo/Idh/MocA family protein, partial [Planctomycetota bacterium]
MKSKITRREFVKKCGTAGAVLALPTIVPSSVFGAGAPSNRITIGCIGTGKKGLNNIKSFMAKSDAQIVALCDVDASHLKDARTKVGLDSRSTYKDFRKLLERKDIDAVVITTPDHWHVPISIAAAKAGKDIYCEKPLSLNIAEGRTLCDVVKRYGRILQTGSQQRSDNEFRFGCELVRNGRIGKLQTIDVQIPANNKTCPPTWQAEPIPAGFDYDS